MEQENNKKMKQLLPLFFVLGGIILVTALWQMFSNTFSIKEFMRIFMGLFFLTFGFFKLLDWNGFAHAFAMYDIIAKKSRLYAYAYPLIELTLGFVYLLNIAPTFVNTTTAIIMFIGSIGVIQAVQKKQEIQCACLGTVIKLPMTIITIIEDIGMGLMALVMLFM